MQDGFELLCREYGIRENVQKEYCDFTTEAMLKLNQGLDLQFGQFKSKIQTLMEMQVLQDAQMIEQFHKKFQAIDTLVREHSKLQTRSLFQVFVDNLTLPGQITEIKNQLDELKAPQSIKEQFQLLVSKCDKVLKSGIEQMLEESGVQTATRKRRIQQQDELAKLAKGKQVADDEYFTYGKEDQP